MTSRLVATPFKVEFDPLDVAELKSALKASRLPRPTWESSDKAGGRYGTPSAWMKEMKRSWEDEFDWKAQEIRINELDHFLADVPFEKGTIKIHFIHQISTAVHSIPLLMLHGWPGSFLEFIDVAKRLRGSKYSLVIPSLPGFTFSDPFGVDRDRGLIEVGQIMDELMLGLGYSEYAIQGGDLGSPIARVMAARYPTSVKCLLLNFIPSAAPLSFLHVLAPEISRNKVISTIGTTLHTILSPFIASPATFNLDEKDLKGLQKNKRFTKDGRGYSMMHSTRPATIAHVVASSPVALLAWIGEKLSDIGWTDRSLSSDEILTSLTLYWLTQSFETSIYTYRELLGATNRNFAANRPEWYINQPTGFSSFVKEITPVPRSWAAQTCRLRWYRYHDQGGHFAAWEQPEVLAQDIDDCFTVLWPLAMGQTARL